MRILFATGWLAMPQMVGGSQKTSDTVIRGLIARGHDVRLLAALKPHGMLGYLARAEMKLRRRGFSADSSLGYKVHRAWDPVKAVGELIDVWRPDVAVALTQRTVSMGRAIQNSGVPLVVAFQDNNFEHLDGDLHNLDPFRSIANSRFTAEKYFRSFGITSDVVYPVIEKSSYVVSQNGNKITLINPDVKKGYDVFLSLARSRPDYDFILVLGWPLSEERMKQIQDDISPLSNVSFVGNKSDMRSIYAETKILLVPSQWEEGYGRVATEAQFSGIPVLGSDKGGLPEAIGPGGAILPADAPTNDWLNALDLLMNDHDHYAKISAAAKGHASRKEIQPDTQIALWERSLDMASRRNHAVDVRSSA